MVNENNQRVVAFGHYAGIAGKIKYFKFKIFFLIIIIAHKLLSI